MAYIYPLSFPHRWRYCPFPFSLPLHSLTYITRQQTIMAASRLATRPGNARSATLFLRRGPPKNTYGAFPYPRPKCIRRGAHPSLSQPMGICRSPTLGKPWSHCPSPTQGKQWSHCLPPLWGTSGAIAHAPLWGTSGAIAHLQSIPNTGATADPQQWGSRQTEPNLQRQPYTNEAKELLHFWADQPPPSRPTNLG